MPNPAHAAVLIGTYKDQLGGDPKAKISEKDKELKKTLKEVLKLDLRSKECFLRLHSEDQLVFAVDNMKGDETELTEDSLVSSPFGYEARQKIATPEEGVIACELQ